MEDVPIDVLRQNVLAAECKDLLLCPVTGATLCAEAMVALPVVTGR